MSDGTFTPDTTIDSLKLSLLFLSTKIGNCSHRHYLKESDLSRMTNMVLMKGEIQTGKSPGGVREMLQ